MQVAARVAVAGVAVASAPLTLPHRTTSRSLAQANTGQQQVAAQVGGSASAEESASTVPLAKLLALDGGGALSSPSPPPTCDSECRGKSCNYWIDELSITCTELNKLQCPCSGCCAESSPPLPPSPPPLPEQARERIAGLADSIHLKEGEQHVVYGRPEREVHRIAKESDVDLIVVGSHGRQGLALILGSTSTSILHGACCDVLAVRVGRG